MKERPKTMIEAFEELGQAWCDVVNVILEDEHVKRLVAQVDKQLRRLNEWLERNLP